MCLLLLLIPLLLPLGEENSGLRDTRGQHPKELCCYQLLYECDFEEWHSLVEANRGGDGDSDAKLSIGINKSIMHWMVADFAIEANNKEWTEDDNKHGLENVRDICLRDAVSSMVLVCMGMSDLHQHQKDQDFQYHMLVSIYLDRSGQPL